MKTADILNKTGGVYSRAKLRHSGGTFMWFAVRIGVLAGFALLCFGVIFPAVRETFDNALLAELPMRSLKRIRGLNPWSSLGYSEGEFPWLE